MGRGTEEKEGEQNVKPLGLGRKCDGESVEGDAKERHWQQILSPRTGSLGPTVTETRKRIERREGTDGDRGRCKRGGLEDGRWIAKCKKKAIMEAKMEVGSTRIWRSEMK